MIERTKWCGKTTTASQIAQSILYLQDPAQKKQNLVMAATDPSFLLEGETPRLIDEWQLAPTLWDAIRFEVDQRNEFGQFILTGSAVPADLSEISHTGIGRISRFVMRPMSLFESEDSNGSVSLTELFSGNPDISGSCDLSLEKLAFLVCRGGWPRAATMRNATALEQAFDYYDAVVNADISRVDNVERNPERVKLLMRSYARHQGTQASNTVIKDDMRINDNSTLDADTVYSYISALKKIFVIEDMPSWNPNLRSKTAIRTSDTRYFVDPSIATAALGLGPNDLMNDLNTFGLFFETMCIRDLRIFADALDGQVYHYRDASGLECDAVIHLRNGSYGLIEIKLGGAVRIEEGAVNLNKLAEKIDTEKMKKPAFKVVLTGIGDFAYCRKDGVLVVPIGSLKN